MKNISVLIVAFLIVPKLFSQGELDTSTLFEMEFLKVVNTSYHEGAPVVSPDGNTLYFFLW
tara:strand:+ start:405 stop:587 length:183 start_codon:yes stop_codon:yes gene_type:complete